MGNVLSEIAERIDRVRGVDRQPAEPVQSEPDQPEPVLPDLVLPDLADLDDEEQDADESLLTGSVGAFSNQENILHPNNEYSEEILGTGLTLLRLRVKCDDRTCAAPPSMFMIRIPNFATASTAVFCRYLSRPGFRILPRGYHFREQSIWLHDRHGWNTPGFRLTSALDDLWCDDHRGILEIEFTKNSNDGGRRVDDHNHGLDDRPPEDRVPEEIAIPVDEPYVVFGEQQRYPHLCGYHALRQTLQDRRRPDFVNSPAPDPGNPLDDVQFSPRSISNTGRFHLISPPPAPPPTPALTGIFKHPHVGVRFGIPLVGPSAFGHPPRFHPHPTNQATVLTKRTLQDSSPLADQASEDEALMSPLELSPTGRTQQDLLRSEPSAPDDESPSPPESNPTRLTQQESSTLEASPPSSEASPPDDESQTIAAALAPTSGALQTTEVPNTAEFGETSFWRRGPYGNHPPGAPSVNVNHPSSTPSVNGNHPSNTPINSVQIADMSGPRILYNPYASENLFEPPKIEDEESYIEMRLITSNTRADALEDGDGDDDDDPSEEASSDIMGEAAPAA